MVNSSSSSEYKNTYSIFTKVKVGKSYKSKGWALNRTDISDIIPVSDYEGKCHLEINNIIAPAKIRINPRLFYHSKELSKHLEDLFKTDSNIKIPLEIKLKREQLYSNFIKKYVDAKPIKFIDLDLTVGKSYSSKGWRINNKISSCFIPLVEYNTESYEIIVDNISSKAILDIQARLFYKSNELADFLKNQSEIDSKGKISARIIFDDDLIVYDLFNKFSKNKEGFIEDSERKNFGVERHFKKNSDSRTLDFYSKSNNHSKGDNMSSEVVDDKCPICGRKLPKNIKKEFIEASEKYSIYCMYCLRRIMALEYFNLFNEKSLSNYVLKEHMRNKLNLDNYDFIWDLLVKCDMLEQIGNSFKLVGNYKIQETYGPIIKSYEELQKPKRPKLVLEPITEEPKIVRKCVICGKILKEDEYEKCSECFSNDSALQEIYKVLPYFSSVARISEKDLPNEEFTSLNKKMIFSNLINNQIIHKNSDDTYNLNFDNLIDFIEKHDSLKNNKIFDSKNNDLKIIFLPNFVFGDESKIDSYINWGEFTDYVKFNKTFANISVTLKNNKKLVSTERVTESLFAKTLAIRFLRDIGIIKLLNGEEIEKFGISRY